MVYVRLNLKLDDVLWVGAGGGGYESLQIVRLEIKDEREDRDSAHASLRFKKNCFVITFHIKKIVNGALETPPSPCPTQTIQPPIYFKIAQ